MRLADYQPYPFVIDAIKLAFDLVPDKTRITSRLDYHATNAATTMWLDGIGLTLEAITLNGKPLDKKQYEQNNKGLWLYNLPAKGQLETTVTINPKQNRTLEGLYIANGIFTTQCEAEGFRHITFYPDRPDVLSVFTTTITAPHPILLSNGNLVRQEKLTDGRTVAEWHDPFKKPAYLFALVGGDLAGQEDTFTTMSGRRVALKLWCEPKYKGRTHFALAALKRSMAWDEKRFGLEYDLDIFQIVAISDFNFGAMENKSLNIFNAQYLLTDPRISTDHDYQTVESIIAHEYFHNWTGDRITLRDWFQLSLKEGLTVFRDQEYSMDTVDRDSERLNQVRFIRSHQFAEDASGLSHPVRPQEYKKINNFYTATVYDKGAELIRMLHRVLGEDAFQKGFRHYIKHQDGKAATIEDFIASFETATGQSCQWLMEWYGTPGTPQVTINEQHDTNNNTYRLEITQHNDKADRPLTVPLAIALIDDNGQAQPLTAEGQDDKGQGDNWRTDTLLGGGVHNGLLLLRDKRTTLVFKGIEKNVTASINRGFSAPIILHQDQPPTALALLLQHEKDGVNRWQAGQLLARRSILACYEQEGQTDKTINNWLQHYSTAFGHLLVDDKTPPLALADNFMLPSFREMLMAVYQQQRAVGADPLRLVAAMRRVKHTIANQHRAAIERLYQKTANAGTDITDTLIPADIAKRAIANAMLDLMVNGLNPEQRDPATDDIMAKLRKHYFDNSNYTLRAGALALAVHRGDDALRRDLLNDYFTTAGDELAVDNYITLVASRDHRDTLHSITTMVASKKITNPDNTDSVPFCIDKPNQVRALLGGLASNYKQFFRTDQAGYKVFLDIIRAVDPINSHTSSQMITVFSSLAQLAQPYRQPIKNLLTALQQEQLSPQLSEMIERTLSAS